MTLKVPLRIRLPFVTEQEFVERYGGNVERGGIFIATRNPKPEGTEISFELVLSNGERLMRGEGVVQQLKSDPAPGKAGMMVRFVRLEPRTKALIDRITASRDGVPAAEPVVTPPSEPLPAPAPKVSAPPPRPSAPPPPPPPKKPLSLADDVVLGIDLGTTTCRAAVFLDGAPRLIAVGGNGQFVLPTVVALDAKGDPVVGHAARGILVSSPQNAAAGFKRVMGRRARSKQIREIAPRCAFTLAADPEGDAGVELAGRTWSAAELAALLLKELKSSASALLGREVTRAVLCVPAWYTDHQRAAMLDAGKRAGLDVLRVLNEPSAVALAFGYGKGLARKRLLVYDLGGGTFDASVVEMTGDDLEVVSTGGDNFLGGVDFDQRLAAALIASLPPAAQEAVLANRASVQRVRDAAESAKISLSDTVKTHVDLPFVASDAAGQPFDLKQDVTRAQLEQLTAELVERTAEITKVVLEAARIPASSVDEVLLVGGQTRAPLVKQRLEAVLSKSARTDVDPQGAVALGAALLGHSLVQRERGKQGITLSEVLSAPIGVAVKGGGFRRVLERNTRLPADKTLEVPIAAETPLQLAVFQGTAARAEDNEYLGALHVVPPKAGELAVRFSVSSDGRLDLSASGPGGKAQITFSTVDASDEIRAAILAAAPLPGEEDAGRRGLLSGLKKLFRAPLMQAP
ncbi:MAG: TIGR02266 family protein [Archangiaceae bacterium]|nr:TIGR02266 family protein [Archangiaceae bacterium]